MSQVKRSASIGRPQDDTRNQPFPIRLLLSTPRQHFVQHRCAQSLSPVRLIDEKVRDVRDALRLSSWIWNFLDELKPQSADECLIPFCDPAAPIGLLDGGRHPGTATSQESFFRFSIRWPRPQPKTELCQLGSIGG